MHGIDELPDLLPEHDVVVVIVPLTDATRGLFDAALLGRLPDGALLVNVARGPVVDTDALVAECASGRLRAALDVTDPEPLPEDHPLWTTPGVLITPHVGGATDGDAAPRRPRAGAPAGRRPLLARVSRSTTPSHGPLSDPTHSGHCQHDRDHRRHRHAQGALDRPQHRPAGLDLEGPHFLMSEVASVAIDTREGARVLAGVKSWHWGPTVQASTDGGAHVDRERRAGAGFPSDTDTALERVWQLTPDPNDADVVWAGVEPHALFKSTDRGEHYELVRGPVGPPAPPDLGARLRRRQRCTRSSPSPDTRSRSSSR